MYAILAHVAGVEELLDPAGRADPGLGERIAEHDDVTLRITPGPWRSWSTAADFAGAHEVPGLLLSLAPTDR